MLKFQFVDIFKSFETTVFKGSTAVILIKAKPILFPRNVAFREVALFHYQIRRKGTTNVTFCHIIPVQIFIYDVWKYVACAACILYLQWMTLERSTYCFSWHNLSTPIPVHGKSDTLQYHCIFFTALWNRMHLCVIISYIINCLSVFDVTHMLHQSVKFNVLFWASS